MAVGAEHGARTALCRNASLQLRHGAIVVGAEDGYRAACLEGRGYTVK